LSHLRTRWVNAIEIIRILRAFPDGFLKPHFGESVRVNFEN
jgi:hypothetical protein